MKEIEEIKQKIQRDANKQADANRIIQKYLEA